MNIYDPKYTELRDKIVKGVELGVQNLIKQRKKDDGELIVVKNNQTVRLSAKDL